MSGGALPALPAAAMLARKGIVWAAACLLLSCSTAAGQQPCTGSGGDFCESVCCYLKDGTIDYCCPEGTKCCGQQRCCPQSSMCSMDCSTNATECIEGGPPRDVPAGQAMPLHTASDPHGQSFVVEDEDGGLLNDNSCDLSVSQCCAGRCCEQCCSSTCAPQNSVCCKAGSNPASCPSTAPACCPLPADPEGSNITTTCCAHGSQCCTDGTCPIDSECCGSCNCCNTKTQRCRDDGSCEHIPQGMLIPFLILLWGAAFFTNLYLLAWLFHDARSLEREVSSLCQGCAHPKHCFTDKCGFRRLNQAVNCVTCNNHCQSQGCHGGAECGLPYTAHERMMRRDNNQEREHVSFKVVHARCPCLECRCKLCLPAIDCKCTECQCTTCKSSTDARPYVVSLALGVVAVITTVVCHFAIDPSSFTLGLIIIGFIWIATAAVLLANTWRRYQKRMHRQATIAAVGPEALAGLDVASCNDDEILPTPTSRFGIRARGS